MKLSFLCDLYARPRQQTCSQDVDTLAELLILPSTPLLTITSAMHLALSAMLSALASSAVATSFPPPASLRQCPGSTLDIPDAIRIHDKNGLVNFHYHYHYPPPITPPTAPPVEQLNVWVDGRVIFVVIIAALCVHQVARVFLRWSSDHNSTVASTKSIPPGRRAAVAGGSPVKRTSQAGASLVIL